MAVAFDKGLGSRVATGLGQNPTLTTSADSAAGALVIVTIGWLVSASETLSSVTDDSAVSPSWHVDHSGLVDSSTYKTAVASGFLAPGNVLPSGTIITFHLSGAPSNSGILTAHAATGLTSGNQLTAVTDTTGTTAWTTATLNVTDTGGAYMLGLGAGGGTTATNTPTSPSSEIYDLTNATLDQVNAPCYRIETTNGSYTVAGTFTSGIVSAWTIGIIYGAGAGGIQKAGSGIIGP